MPKIGDRLRQSSSIDPYTETLEGFYTHDLFDGLNWAAQTVLYYAFGFGRPIPENIHLLTPQVAKEIGYLVFGRNFENIREWRERLPRGHEDTKEDITYLLFNILGTVVPWNDLPGLLPKTKFGNRQHPSAVKGRVERVAREVFDCEPWQLRQKVYDGLTDRLGYLIGVPGLRHLAGAA